MTKDRGFGNFVLGVGLCAVAVVLAQRDGLPRELADGVQSASHDYHLAVGNTDQGRGTRDTVFVLDPATQRLAVYTWSPGQGALTLSAVREVTYDLKIEEFSNAGKDLQTPSVKKVKEEYEKKKP
jgi:hypothetical protein